MNENKTENRPEYACYGKQVFLTFSHAKKVARQVRRRKGLAKTPYQCPYCQKFHIGAPSMKRKRPARDVP